MRRASGLRLSNPETRRLHDRIVELVLGGMDHRAAAEELMVSRSTVRYHVGLLCNCEERGEPARQREGTG